jgi:hypothetical protein
MDRDRVRDFSRNAFIAITLVAVTISAGCRSPVRSATTARGARDSSATVQSSIEPTLGTGPASEAGPGDVANAKRAARRYLDRQLDWDYKLALDGWGGGKDVGRYWRVSQKWWRSHDEPPYMYVLLTYAGDGVGAFGWVDVVRTTASGGWTVFDSGGGF